MFIKQTKLILLFLIFSTVAKAQFVEQWHQTINGQGDFGDRYTCIVADDSGNIYVGGSSSTPNQNTDFLVAKYNSAGTIIWKKTWNGTGNGPDEANAILFHNGNIYITGYLNTAGFGNDFFTLALSDSGDSLWGGLYNDPTFNQYEQANAIAADASGNIIVCGESDRDPSNITNDDFLTIKYSNTGTQEWVQRFNDIGNATDRAAAVVVDAAGNIYVTGRSDNGNDDDYATIKYNSAGVQQWSQFMDNGAIDRAADMGIDDAGNIYVTGRSNNGADDDFRTIKYNAAGLEVFNVAYDYVEDDRSDLIDVNPDGSFAIAGRSDGNATLALNYNFRVVKYSNSGVQQWTNAYDSPAAADDIVKGLDLGTDGFVAITGYSDVEPALAIQNDITTILYNNSGGVVWTKNQTGPGISQDLGNGCLIDASGNVFVVGQTEDNNLRRDAIILKYDAAGNTAATSFYSGIGDNGDNVRDLEVDGSNNVYICGYSVSKDADRNMFVCKLNNVGDTLWTRQINGTMFGSDEESNALALDASGNVIISGYTKNAGSSSDITVAKYSPTGTLLWTTLYNGPSNESDRAYDVVTDISGNVFITGKTDINNSPVITNDQVFTARINANGSIAWTAIYDGGNGIDRGRFIRVAPSGNIYVIGRKFNGTDDDFLVIKYNTLGIQQWAQSINGISGNDDPHDAEIDALENVYFTGVSETSLNSLQTDYFTAAYNSAGTLLWSENYNGAGNGIDVSEGIEINSSGKVFVTGFSDQQSNNEIQNACVTICYDATGNEVWNHTYQGTSSIEDVGDDLALDSNGDVFVALHSNLGSVTEVNYHLVTLSINPLTGNPQGTAEFGISDSINVANVIKVKTGNIYLGGSIWSAIGQRDILILKYAFTTNIAEADVFSEMILFPNPCDNNLTLRLENFKGMQSAVIYDVNGNMVKSQKIYPGQTTLELADLSPGFYSCEVLTATRKFRNSFIKK